MLQFLTSGESELLTHHFESSTQSAGRNTKHPNSSELATSRSTSSKLKIFLKQQLPKAKQTPKQATYPSGFLFSAGEAKPPPFHEHLKLQMKPIKYLRNQISTLFPNF